MSKLKERLIRLRKENNENAQTVDYKHEKQSEDVTKLSDAWTLEGTVWCENRYGRFIKKICTFPPDYQHGLYQICQLNREVPHFQMNRHPSKEKSTCQLSQLLFIDTETTGLGVGTGNVPFMIGIGWWESETFVIEQLFMRNPSEEAAMLHYLQEKLSLFRGIVTFNGKSFDWPLIKNRYVLHRMHMSEIEMHLDLLYISRSLWKNTIPSCRLGVVETEQLQFQREDDIPGSLAPALYFQFLQNQQPETIAAVFRHNEWDILTLAVLTIHFSKLLNGETDWKQQSMEQIYRYGLWLERLGNISLAEEIMHFLYKNKESIKHIALLHELACWYKKRRSFDIAVILWKHACFNGATDENMKKKRYARVDTLIELAKYYEHRTKNIDKALTYAKLAHEQMQLHLSWSRRNHKYDKVAEDIVHRIRRLEKKQKNDHGDRTQARLFH